MCEKCDKSFEKGRKELKARQEAVRRVEKAAPELLKATKQALEIFEGEWPEDDEVMGPVMIEYRALINRAEGGK